MATLIFLILLIITAVAGIVISVHSAKNCRDHLWTLSYIALLIGSMASLVKDVAV